MALFNYHYCLLLVLIVAGGGSSASGAASRRDEDEQREEGAATPPWLATTQAVVPSTNYTSSLLVDDERASSDDGGGGDAVIQSSFFCHPSSPHHASIVRDDTPQTCQQQQQQQQHAFLQQAGEEGNHDQNITTTATTITTTSTTRTSTTTKNTTSTTSTCGPNCRPSCLTLKLDLKKKSSILSRPTSSTVPSSCADSAAAAAGPCRHTKNQQSSSLCDSSSPNTSCQLENAKCVGPIVYEDTISWLTQQLLEEQEKQFNDTTSGTGSSRSSITDQLPPSCSYIPHSTSSRRLDRFRGWPVVLPMTVHCDDDDNDNSKCFRRDDDDDDEIYYFEFCHVLHEDPLCDLSCDDPEAAEATATAASRCDTNSTTTPVCAQHVAPFADGWTSFVVSAPLMDIPSSSGDDADGNNRRNSTVRTSSGGVTSPSSSSCWMQRIDLYFPPDCPHCHACPLLSLADHLGELEIVGFGHSIDQPCAPCDITVATKAGTTGSSAAVLDCLMLQQCQHLGDCETGETIGLPPFVANHCSWSVTENDLVYEDGFDPSSSPQQQQQQGGGGIGTVGAAPRDESPVATDQNVSNDSWTQKKKKEEGGEDAEEGGDSSLIRAVSTMLPLIVPPVCLVIVSLLLLSFVLHYRKSRNRPARVVPTNTTTKQQQQPEEIVYIDDDEERIMNMFIETASNDSSSIVAVSSREQDDEDNKDDDGAAVTVSGRINDANNEESVSHIQTKKSGNLQKKTAARPHKQSMPSSRVAVKFRTASLIQQHGKDEVEVVETTGVHHVAVRWV
jgi:hypothetical protein